MSTRSAQTDCCRVSKLATVTLVCGLIVGWSCQPNTVTPDVRIELVQSAWIEDPDMLLLVTSIEEADPFRSHGRLELSWIDSSGSELFRSLYNTSSLANPTPPGTFGVFDLENDSVMSAGTEGDWEVTHNGFTLLTDSATVRRDGVLSVNWAIRPPPSLTGVVELRARVIPNKRDTGKWQSIGRLECIEGSWWVAEETASEVAAVLLTSAKDGDAEAALRSLETLWDQGTDPKTIEEIRARALETIDNAGRFSVGSESYPLRDIQTVYEWMLKTPDVLRHRLVVDGDLEPDRLLHLAVAVGREHAEPAKGNSEYVLPEIDIIEAIQNSDPWVVSAALFIARKQQVELDLGEIVARWQGTKPWDDICTEQALLYLAGRQPAELDAVALPLEAAALENVDPAGVEIQPWLFLSSAGWSAELDTVPLQRGLVLEVRDSTMDVITTRPVASDDITLMLSATRNYYSFSYLDGPMHGSSRFIDGEPGVFVRMAIGVNGGV